jgi:hypothetical protein
MRRLFSLSLLLSLFVISSEAFAACWWQWEGFSSRWVCDECGSNGCTEIGTPGPTAHQITIKNSCYRPGTTAVAVYYLAASSNSWRSDGYWHLNPGETANAGTTYNGTFYYWAKNHSQGNAWEGDEGPWNLHGDRLRFRKKDGFHVNLTCND